MDLNPVLNATSSPKRKWKMSANKVRLTREEQIFLMEMLETNDVEDAAEQFAVLMVMENVNPTELEEYLKKVMKRIK